MIDTMADFAKNVPTLLNKCGMSDLAEKYQN